MHSSEFAVAYQRGVVWSWQSRMFDFSKSV